MRRRLTAVLLALCIITSTALPAFASEEKDQKGEGLTAEQSLLMETSEDAGGFQTVEEASTLSMYLVDVQTYVDERAVAFICGNASIVWERSPPPSCMRMTLPGFMASVELATIACSSAAAFPSGAPWGASISAASDAMWV